jgi:soluble lytic murein transglycosylase-like protein
MKRSMVAIMTALGLASLSCETPTPGLGNELAAAPEVFEEAILPYGEDDPHLEVARTYLQGRHTGLARTEIDALAELVVSEARRHGLNPRLVLAVIQVESGGYNFAVSGVGALGLMQLMPGTGQELAGRHGIEWRGDETLLDPFVNVRLGTAYLRQLSDRYGSIPTALAAYNWGPGRIDRRLRRGNHLPSIYIRQVMEVYAAEEVTSRRS